MLEREKTPLLPLRSRKEGDERKVIAEQAHAVIVAGPPAKRQRVILHDDLEVVAVVAAALKGLKNLPADISRYAKPPPTACTEGGG